MADETNSARRDDDAGRTDETRRSDRNSPRRRDVLRAGAAAGVLGVTGLTLNGASAQETTPADGDGQGGTGVFSFSLEEGDLFRVRLRPRDPFGEPATETIPGGCLDGQSAEYQIFVVRAFRDDSNLGYRGLFAPQAAIETETGTTPGEETTLPETTPGEETTPADGELPEIQRGEWYRVTASESCDGMNRLTVETAEPPETTPGEETTPEETTPEETTPQ